MINKAGEGGSEDSKERFLQSKGEKLGHTYYDYRMEVGEHGGKTDGVRKETT